MPIIRLDQKNALVDGRQSQIALMIQQGMMRYFAAHNMVALAEFPLKNGRRADLLALDQKGQFTLVEIKSSFEDFRADNKWPLYRDFCDRFYFATSAWVDRDIFPDDEGLFVTDEYGAECLREAQTEAMNAASRKALLLRFARLAASRLDRLARFGMEQGFHLPPDDETGN